MYLGQTLKTVRGSDKYSRRQNVRTLSETQTIKKSTCLPFMCVFATCTLSLPNLGF